MKNIHYKFVLIDNSENINIVNELMYFSVYFRKDPSHVLININSEIKHNSS